MTTSMNKRFAFRPSVAEAQLEERQVLSSMGTVLTPPPAPPPVPSAVTIQNLTPWRTVKQLRAAYAHQVKLAILDLRNEVGRGVQQLFANGSAPTSHQLSDFNMGVQGALGAPAFQPSRSSSRV
jgi:hypothetical protein